MAYGLIGRRGNIGILDTYAQGSLRAATWRCFSSRWYSTDAIWKYYLSRLPWRFFVHLKNGVFLR